VQDDTKRICPTAALDKVLERLGCSEECMFDDETKRQLTWLAEDMVERTVEFGALAAMSQGSSWLQARRCVFSSKCQGNGCGKVAVPLSALQRACQQDRLRIDFSLQVCCRARTLRFTCSAMTACLCRAAAAWGSIPLPKKLRTVKTSSGAQQYGSRCRACSPHKWLLHRRLPLEMQECRELGQQAHLSRTVALPPCEVDMLSCC
jgi:hypothetical protein